MRKWLRRRRRHRPRHGYRYRRRRHGSRWRRSTVLAVLALAAVIASTALLDWYRTSAAAAELAEYARERRFEPAELAVAASRGRRVIFLGDVRPEARAKRIAAEVTEALARGPGLDALVLEVPSDEQWTIDRYLESDPEDVALLLSRPRTVRGERETSRAYLDLYRRVRELNRDLPPGRTVRIIAADLPDWPPPRAATPARVARLYARRDAHMAETIEREVFRHSPRARILVFMGGYHGLKSHARVHYSGGGEPVELTWLAARLEARGPAVYSIFTDASRQAHGFGTLPSYGPTRAFRILDRRATDEATTPFAVPVDEHFDFMDKPIHAASAPGLTLELLPRGYRLRDLIDAYLFLASGRTFRVVR